MESQDQQNYNLIFQELPESEKKEMQDGVEGTFSKADQDCDGFISLSEWQNFMRENGKQSYCQKNDSQMKQDLLHKFQFEWLDKNKAGRLSKFDYAKILVEGFHSQTIEDAFKIYWSVNQPTIIEQSLLSYFESLDQDKDGLVSYIQFMQSFGFIKQDMSNFEERMRKAEYKLERNPALRDSVKQSFTLDEFKIMIFDGLIVKKETMTDQAFNQMVPKLVELSKQEDKNLDEQAWDKLFSKPTKDRKRILKGVNSTFQVFHKNDYENNESYITLSQYVRRYQEGYGRDMPENLETPEQIRAYLMFEFDQLDHKKAGKISRLDLIRLLSDTDGDWNIYLSNQIANLKEAFISIWDTRNPLEFSDRQSDRYLNWYFAQKDVNNEGVVRLVDLIDEDINDLYQIMGWEEKAMLVNEYVSEEDRELGKRRCNDDEIEVMGNQKFTLKEFKELITEGANWKGVMADKSYADLIEQIFKPKLEHSIADQKVIEKFLKEKTIQQQKTLLKQATKVFEEADNIGGQIVFRLFAQKLEQIYEGSQLTEQNTEEKIRAFYRFAFLHYDQNKVSRLSKLDWIKLLMDWHDDKIDPVQKAFDSVWDAREPSTYTSEQSEIFLNLYYANKVDKADGLLLLKDFLDCFDLEDLIQFMDFEGKGMALNHWDEDLRSKENEKLTLVEFKLLIKSKIAC